MNLNILIGRAISTVCVNDDVQREIRCLFVRTNILLRRFGKYSASVKLSLFRAYCMCFYDRPIGLWSKYSVTVFKRMEACYNKCIKSFLNIVGLTV